jgi:uncharacterized protein
LGTKLLGFSAGANILMSRQVIVLFRDAVFILRIWMQLAYRIGKIVLLMVGIYFLINFSSFLGGNFSVPQSQEPLNYALLFVAGTLTGFHCAGMCGALVVGYTVRMANQGGSKYLTHLYYGIGKTLSYTVMGALFGVLGSIVTFTPAMRGWAGLVAAAFLILFGLSSLRLLPVKRELQFKVPPVVMKYLGGLLRKAGNPFSVGLLNGLMIICGPLQAMYILAAGTGSPVEGAKMLFFFGLGTLPLMMGFGFLASTLSSQVAPKLVRFSGVIVIALGVMMAQRGYHMLTTGEDAHAAMGHHSMAGGSGAAAKMIHTVIDQPGPIQDVSQIEVGTETQWMVMGKALEQCGGALLFSEQHWRFELPPEGRVISLRPSQAGMLHWACASGFSEGSIEVRPKVVGSPSQRLPMAEEIAKLIEKSARAIEALRHQLHP